MYKDKSYFYITTDFSNKYKETLFEKVNENVYRHKVSNELFRKRAIYNFGDGQENGFEIIPPLGFTELIELVISHDRDDRKRERKDQHPIAENNLIGAVSVIMEDHIEELIDFLAERIETDFFDNPRIRESFRYFSFSDEKQHEMGLYFGGIGRLSYEEVLNQYPSWLQISSRVTELVYPNDDIKDFLEHRNINLRDRFSLAMMRFIFMIDSVPFIFKRNIRKNNTKQITIHTYEKTDSIRINAATNEPVKNHISMTTEEFMAFNKDHDLSELDSCSITITDEYGVTGS